MINNAVLDIAIALVLMFLVLSLMGTVINELIATAISLRAKTLKAAIQNLLDDPNLRAAFYKHGLIDGAKKTAGDPSYLTGETFAMAIVGSLDPAKPLPGFAEAQAAIQKMPDSNIRDALLAQVTKAGTDIVKLRNETANYFDSSMDRVSGVYKRYLKWISLGVGFVMVVALNADTIKVGAALWNDASLRAQMVASAQSELKAGPPAATGSAATTSYTTQLIELEKKVRPLPIGLTSATFDFLFSASTLKWLFTLPGFWWALTKLAGLTITALAISLGAPFWFDILQKFMNVRGTGIKPGSAAAEIRKQAVPTATVSTVKT